MDVHPDRERSSSLGTGHRGGNVLPGGPKWPKLPQTTRWTSCHASRPLDLMPILATWGEAHSTAHNYSPVTPKTKWTLALATPPVHGRKSPSPNWRSP